MKRRVWKAALVLLAAIAVCPLQAGAAEGYRGYTYNAYNNAVPSQIGYTAERLVTAGDMQGEWGSFDDPSDLYITDEGRMYILDSGNGRVAVTDAQFQPLAMVDAFRLPDGQETSLLDPAGLFVDKERRLYIADTGNARVIRCDEAGRIDRVYARPETDVLKADTVFKPTKVLADSSGYLCVLADGIYEGALVYDEEGRFSGFYGSNRVEVTLQLLGDLFWKKLMSEEQAGYLSKYVPDEFSNFDIDGEGFIYTCTQSAQVKTDKVKKLNAAGDNVLRGEGTFGEKDGEWVKGQQIVSQMVDIQADGGYIRVLDAVRGRVYEYDGNGELLLIFGGTGQQTGTFRNPVALESFGGKVYVLDAANGGITAFALTQFGEAVHRAVGLYNEGLYDEARASWEYILSLDCHYDLAYNGIGKALSGSKHYEEAAAYFRLAQNRTAESDAFAAWRSDWIQSHFVWILIGIAVLTAGLSVLYTWRKRRAAACGVSGRERGRGAVFLHPVEVFEERKQKGRFGTAVPAAAAILIFVTAVLQRQATGFRFNTADADSLNLLLVFAGTTVVFAAAVLSNWAVCTLLDGKGRLREIAGVFGYSLLPYTAAVVLMVGLSQFLTLG